MQQGKGNNYQYFNQLDGFRFFSVLAVMLSHFAPFGIIPRLPLGYGVFFFFVLSSFLITRILLIARQKNELRNSNHLFSLRQFYLRRFLRIFPIYYLLVLTLTAINWAPSRNILSYLLTYTTNFMVGKGVDAGDFTHLWSLAVEEQFYIFFPFIIFFVDIRYLLRMLIAFTLIGLLGRASLYIYNSSYIPFSNFHTISCLDSLGLGAILAYWSIYKIQLLKKIIGHRIFFMLSIILFTGTMLASYTLQPENNRVNFISIVFMRFLFSVMSFWMLGWAVLFGYKGILKKILEWKIIVYLGRISYGLYLYHLFVPTLVTMVLQKMNIRIFENGHGMLPFVLPVIYIVVTVIISTGSWYCIEKPLNNFKKYFNYNKKTTVEVPAV